MSGYEREEPRHPAEPMTIKEFYEWAKAKGIENYVMVNEGDTVERDGFYEPSDFYIYHDEKRVKTQWEC